MCARETFHTSRDCYSNNPEHLLCSPRAFGQSLYWVLPDTWDWTRMHALAVMHRRKLCENVDSAKIKLPFFILQISIFYAWHRCIISSYIVLTYRSISINRYTPIKEISTETGHCVQSCFWHGRNCVVLHDHWDHFKKTLKNPTTLWKMGIQCPLWSTAIIKSDLL